MCTTKEGKELEDVWKKYRWFYRRVDPEDMKYLDWIRVSFMKVDFSIRDGEICARTGGLRDRFHRMDTEPQRGSDIVREARRASPRRHSWHLSRTAQIQPYIRNGYGGVHLRKERASNATARESVHGSASSTTAGFISYRRRTQKTNSSCIRYSTTAGLF